MVITAVMLHKQRRLVRAFEQAGATGAVRARTAEELGLQPGIRWCRLVAHAVAALSRRGALFSGRG
jgi:hypothetical protein